MFLNVNGQKIDRIKTILSMVIFSVVFIGLTLIATYFDLQISKILTKGSLEAGKYISSSGFALFFEALGSSPIYIMVSIAGVIAFWYGIRMNKKVKYVYAFVGAVMVIVGFFFTFKDMFAYIGEFMGANLTSESMENILIDEGKDLAGSVYILAIALLLATLSSFALIALWKRIPKEKNDKLIIWAYMIVCTMAGYLIVHFVKSPVGRVRYRTMNYLGNFDYYTPWYVMNGKRKMFDLIGAAETSTRYNFVSDACKSFPSGHTFSAGMVYTLLALPYLCDRFNKKSSRILLWVATIGYTGIVAISRIVAGAHYMSDVLFGGTIAFLSAMIAREILVLKGAHFKVLFGKCNSGEVAVEETTEEASIDEAKDEDSIETEIEE